MIKGGGKVSNLGGRRRMARSGDPAPGPLRQRGDRGDAGGRGTGGRTRLPAVSAAGGAPGHMAKT